VISKWFKCNHGVEHTRQDMISMLHCFDNERYKESPDGCWFKTYFGLMRAVEKLDG
jgi:hypothetical protein